MIVALVIHPNNSVESLEIIVNAIGSFTHQQCLFISSSWLND